MAKPKTSRNVKPITLEQAAQKLPAEISRREHLLGEYQKAHADYHAAHDNLAACHRAMSRTAGELKKNQAVIDRMRAIVDAGPSRPAPELREIDAPLMTDAEFYHQLQADPDAENPASSTALFSMDEYIGGFSRFTARKDYQEVAAARFLSLYERSQLGGARASDLSQPFVDRSGQTASGVEASGQDARREYRAVQDAIGKSATAILELVIVGRVSARMIAAKRTGKTPGNVHGKAVAVAAQEVWDAMDKLTTHFELTPNGYKSSRRVLQAKV